MGRDIELSALRDAVEKTRAGSLSVVLIEGEAGIGKSALLRAAASWAEDDDAVLLGLSVPLVGEELPFGVVADALRDLVRREGPESSRSAAPSAARTLGFLVPELGDEDVIPAGRVELLDAVVRVLSALARDRVVWFLVEDLHWADSSSLDVISLLVRAARTRHLVVMGTYRDGRDRAGDARERFIDELVREPGVVRLRLGRLPADAVAEQVEALHPGAVEPALVSRVVKLSQGVPFLAEELIRGGIQPTGPLPSSVADLMLRRLTPLSGQAVRIVQAGSVGYGRLWHRLLGAVCGLTQDELAECCAEAVDANVLEVDETGLAYRFCHTLLREVVLGSLLPADRLRWHERWAVALEKDDVSPDREFGRMSASRHWWETGDSPRAFAATLDAVAVARHVQASAELGPLLRRLLTLWPDVIDAAELAGARDLVLDEAIDAAATSDDWPAGLRLIDDELAAAASDDRVRRTALKIRRRWFLEQLGRDDSGREPDDQALATLAAAEPGPLVVEGLIRLGFDLVPSDPAAASSAHVRAVEVADLVGEPRKWAWAASQQAHHLALTGRVPEAIALAEEVLRTARQDSPIEAAVLEADCSWWYSCLGRYDDAVEMGVHALNGIARRERARRTWALASAAVATALQSLGRWEQAEARLREAGSSAVVGTRGAVLAVLSGILAAYRGDEAGMTDAVSSVRIHLPEQRDGVWPPIRAWVGWLEAEVAAARDDIEAMRRTVAPLWAMTGLEISSDVVWRPLLVAARFESDRARRAFGRRGGRAVATTAFGTTHMTTLKGVGSATLPDRRPRFGVVGSARCRDRSLRGCVGPAGLDRGRGALGSDRAATRTGLGSASGGRVGGCGPRQARGGDHPARGARNCRLPGSVDPRLPDRRRRA